MLLALSQIFQTRNLLGLFRYLPAVARVQSLQLIDPGTTLNQSGNSLSVFGRQSVQIKILVVNSHACSRKPAALSKPQ